MDGAATQLLDEIRSTIIRYSSESDVTISEAIGVLELAKAELIDDALNGESEEDEESSSPI